MPEVLSRRALCSVEDVLAHVSAAAAPDDADMLTRLINAASRAIHRRAGREFRADNGATPVASARLFDLYRGREVAIGDLQDTPTAARLLGDDGAELAILTPSAGLQALPLVREEWEPVTALRFRPAVSLGAAAQVEVTGLWGFPLVPEDVRQACLVQVREWFTRDSAQFGEAFADSEDVAIVMRALSRPTWEVATSYRLPAIA